jgi:small-conductance mechanosensitive channel
MRPLSFAAATLVLVASLSCRKQRANETGGMSDSSRTQPTAEPTPPPTDTTPSAPDFTFDQRQNFAQGIRQQLTDLDRQIGELSSQAKSRGGAVSDRALANIRTTRRSVDRSLSRVNTATAVNWDQIKQSINQAVASLSESIEAAQPK